MIPSRSVTSLGIISLLLAAGGCGPPALYQVDTVIHQNGACDRAIWQPEGQDLPEEASTPAWKARWKSMDHVPIPPAFAGEFQPDQEHPYFHAGGTFADLSKVPDHFRRVEPIAADAGASVLIHAHHRESFGFVVEHRWSETLTNIVTRERFMKARNLFIDRAIPRVVDALNDVYGPEYDVTRLGDYIRKEGPRFLRELADAFYETSARHAPEPEQALAYARAARTIGIDLFDESGKLLESGEIDKRVKLFAKHRVALRIRHRDGSRLTEREVEMIVGENAQSVFDKRWQSYLESRKKPLAEALAPPLVGMTGLYDFPPLMPGPTVPRFAFRVKLPGELAETNGTAEQPGVARWRFTGSQCFPDGFKMTARSLEIDGPAQERVFQRKPITNREQARQFVEILRDNPPLHAMMNTVRETGNMRVLEQFQPATDPERHQFASLRRLLGLPG